MLALQLQLLLVFLLNKALPIYSHGRLISPIARTSAWRINKLLPSYTDDGGMNCGGVYTLLNNDGKCGICGESFNSAKLFEKGGKYYTGSIVKAYTQGQIIPVFVEITPNHRGYFQFGICNIDNSDGDATQECLDANKLHDLYNQNKIKIPHDYHNGQIVTYLRLPQNLTCNHCVFQWKYTSANSWGRDTNTGRICLGCGPQEQFIGCSDIFIRPDEDSTPPPNTTDTTSTTTDTTSTSPDTTSTFTETTSTTTDTTSTNTDKLSTTTNDATKTTTESQDIESNSYNSTELCSKGDGFYPRNKCRSFYRCYNNLVYFFECPPGTLFDTKYNVCNWPYNVNCD